MGCLVTQKAKLAPPVDFEPFIEGDNQDSTPGGLIPLPTEASELVLELKVWHPATSAPLESVARIIGTSANCFSPQEIPPKEVDATSPDAGELTDPRVRNFTVRVPATRFEGRCSQLQLTVALDFDADCSPDDDRAFSAFWWVYEEGGDVPVTVEECLPPAPE